MKFKSKGGHAFKSWVKSLPVRHKKGECPTIFLFGTPRGGLTWLAEAVFACPGLRCVSEPMNLRTPWVKENSKLQDWGEMWDPNLAERVVPYFGKLAAGDNRLNDLSPFRSIKKYGWRFSTNRTLFKVNHCGAQCLDELLRHFNGPIILLFRHPIATAFSRERFPALEAWSKAAQKPELSELQQKMVESIICSGSHLERGVLAWCLHNQKMIEKFYDKRYLCLTYEEMVLEPEKALGAVAEYCNLNDVDRMIAAANLPSVTTRKSDQQKKAILQEENGEMRKIKILSRWKKQLSEDETNRVQGILDVFEVKLYSASDILPLSTTILDQEFLRSTV